jgi:hypothetical protein
MKCPFRHSEKTTHKNGDETTSTEWLKCYEGDCPAYRADKTCAKIIIREEIDFPAMPGELPS